MDIVNSILYINPDAKFAAWNCSLEEYQGESDPIKLGSLLIDWSPANTQPCPKQEQLEALDPVKVGSMAEAKRKTARDKSAITNLNIMSNYHAYLLAKPGTTLTAYLDVIESLMSKI